MKDKRLFFALWPDTATRANLKKISDDLPSCIGKPVSVDNLHITLAFPGRVSEEQTKQLLSGTEYIASPSFFLKIDQSGWWKRTGVLWLAPTKKPEALMLLVDKINVLLKSCELSVEERPYSPHITLARKVEQSTKQPTFRPIVWDINDFCLVESITHATGPEYKIIGRWPLSSV